MTAFTKYLVTFDGRDAVQAAAAIRETSKYPIWGVWAGMSGIASNELIVMTRYDGLASWSTSRNPHADARAIFRERHALLHSTTAVATRLLV